MIFSQQSYQSSLKSKHQN